MSPVKALMIETLRALCQPGGACPAFRAAMILRTSGPVWGIWHHVYEVRWLLQTMETYERSVRDTGYWPSELAKAREWAAANVAPPPFIKPCPNLDFYCEDTVLHDLRYLASCPRVLDSCPWLPERLAAVETLGELS